MQAYLTAQGDTYAGRFNASGRAYPDVAAQGQRFAVTLNGQSVTVSGTSASAPAFAAAVALVNDELLGTGRAPLGFLNPMLYSTGAVSFNDVTSGNNPGCGTDGFEARAGWDPVSLAFSTMCGCELCSDSGGGLGNWSWHSRFRQTRKGCYWPSFNSSSNFEEWGHEAEYVQRVCDGSHWFGRFVNPGQYVALKGTWFHIILGYTTGDLTVWMCGKKDGQLLRELLSMHSGII